MTKVKVIKGSTTGWSDNATLEEAVNTFIADKTVTDIKPLAGPEQGVLVIYEEA